MTKHFCDRCNREIGTSNSFHPKTDVSFRMDIQRQIEDATGGMFCEPCLNDIKDAWKALCKEVRATKT